MTLFRLEEMYDNSTVNESFNIINKLLDLQCSVYNILYKVAIKKETNVGNQARHLINVFCQLLKHASTSDEAAKAELQEIITGISEVAEAASKYDDPVSTIVEEMVSLVECKNACPATQQIVVIFGILDFYDIKVAF